MCHPALPLNNLEWGANIKYQFDSVGPSISVGVESEVFRKNVKLEFWHDLRVLSYCMSVWPFISENKYELVWKNLFTLYIILVWVQPWGNLFPFSPAAEQRPKPLKHSHNKEQLCRVSSKIYHNNIKYFGLFAHVIWCVWGLFTYTVPFL